MTTDQTPSACHSFSREMSWVFRLSACVLIAFAGCSSGPTHFKIKGKVVDGDKALLPEPGSSIAIVFTQIVDEGKFSNSFAERLSTEDGSFEIAGNELTGMPAGKYRVKLSSISPNPAAAPAIIKLINQRFSTDRSPIEVTIVDDKNPVVIDIAPFKKK